MTQLTREQVLELFHQRSSTRYYDPAKKISDEDFECILECGRLSPSFVDVMARKGLNAEQQQAALAKYKALQEEDMKLLESDRTLFDWCSKQTYIALANMLTGAAALGIDSCPIEGFHYDKMNECLAEEGLFDPKEYAVSVAATFGYRSRDIAKKSRKALDEVVRWVE